MKTTNVVNSRLESFWKQLSDAEQAVLLLDYDGTLAPFSIERDYAFPYPGVRKSLTSIMRLSNTRVVIISGRAIDDLLPLLALEVLPEIWGCHGWERLEPNGSRTAIAMPKTAKVGLEDANLWICQNGLEPFLENKPASLAIHWRGRSEIEIARLRERVLDGWQNIAQKANLEIHPFNGGIELRCPGINKGTAIETILEQVSSTVPVAFLGDDLTDEDGFAVVRNKGLGILVNPELRQTLADLQIAPPEELLNFLSQWLIKAPKKAS